MFCDHFAIRLQMFRDWLQVTKLELNWACTDENVQTMNFSNLDIIHICNTGKGSFFNKCVGRAGFQHRTNMSRWRECV